MDTLPEEIYAIIDDIIRSDKYTNDYTGDHTVDYVTDEFKGITVRIIIELYKRGTITLRAPSTPPITTTPTTPEIKVKEVPLVKEVKTITTKKPTTKKLNPKDYVLNDKSEVYKKLELDKFEPTDADFEAANNPDFEEDLYDEEESRAGLCNTKKANGQWCMNKAKTDGKCGVHNKTKK